MDTGHVETFTEEEHRRDHFKVLINEFRHLPLLSIEMSLAGVMRSTQLEEELSQKMLFKKFGLVGGGLWKRCFGMDGMLFFCILFYK